jgi:hypothetical protein
MNHDLERELGKALRRHEPSPDFAERVMARVAEQSPVTRVDAPRETISLWHRLTGIFQMPQWQLPQLRWATAGALACLLAVFGTLRYREHQRVEAERLAFEMAEGERAKEQVIFALQLASAKLNVAQRKVRESSEYKVENP